MLVVARAPVATIAPVQAGRLIFVGILSEENADLQLYCLKGLRTDPLSALGVEDDQISLGGQR